MSTKLCVRRERTQKHGIALFILALLLLGVSGCAAGTVGDAPFVAAVDSADTSIMAATGIEEPRIDIRSETGIGEAEFLFAAGAVPEDLVFRFYLNGLESLQFTNGEVTVRASVASYADQAVVQSVIENGQESPIDSGSPYWLSITLGSTAGADAVYFDVRPPALHAQDGALRITLLWIDFYR